MKSEKRSAISLCALSLVDQLQMRGGRVQVPQNVVAIVDRRQIFGRVPIDVERKQIDAELHQKIDAMDVTLGGGQMQAGVAELIRFVRIAADVVGDEREVYKYTSYISY